jgi:Ran GTPase-activating protein (RanGAP) involved in mRNA processing and transport
MRLQGREGEIRVLDLGNNSMTEVGAAALARLLHGKRSLRELNLYMNDIQDGGVSTVCMWNTVRY